MNYDNGQMSNYRMNPVPMGNVQVMSLQMVPGQPDPYQIGPGQMAPFQMTPAMVPNSQGVNVVVIQNQKVIQLGNNQLGACSVQVKCPYCKSIESTIVENHFNCSTCLFKVYIIILINIVFLLWIICVYYYIILYISILIKLDYYGVVLGNLYNILF